MRIEHKPVRTGLLTLLALGFAGLAHAGDREDIAAVIEKYRVLEEKGEFIEQGKLMTDDRVMMYPGGRKTGDNRQDMREQQAFIDRFNAEFPGVHYQVEIRNMEIRSWGDSAMVTLEWFPTRVVPASLPKEKAAKLGTPKPPVIAAVMLVKLQGAWKIAFTAFVPQAKPAA